MKLGIQRRNMCLVPPLGLDRHWVARLFDRPDIHLMFGFDTPAGAHMGFRLTHEPIVLGILKPISHNVRIGFVLMFPPTDIAHYWEIGYAITSVKHRDAFTAMNALDCMGCYMWEHHGAELLGGRTRDDNHQADAVVRRNGYAKVDEVMHQGHRYNIYTQDRAGWDRRRAKHDAGEALHPSPGGSAFVVLPPPGFTPVIREGYVAPETAQPAK